jgi:hypothetical protein
MQEKLLQESSTQGIASQATPTSKPAKKEKRKIIPKSAFKYTHLESFT